MRISNENRIPLAILTGALMIAFAVYAAGESPEKRTPTTAITKAVLIEDGSLLPTQLKTELLEQLNTSGVIDGATLPWVNELNLLWALGLSNSNPLLSQGPIASIKSSSPLVMASVGGWTVSNGHVMDHYGRHTWIQLDPAAQAKLERLAQKIYRPCCDNDTYLPDCNHGMAMLGLLELLLSQGASEEEVLSKALLANMEWFPDEYTTIARYLATQGIDIKQISPEEILGKEFSSATGYAEIAKNTSVPASRKNTCGIDGSSCNL